MFDWLLIHPKADFDAGTLSFASSLSPLLLAIFIALAALLLGFSLWRRRTQLSPQKLGILWLLQTLVASILLALIWQPTLKVETISAGDNSVVVLIDSSASMQMQTTNSSSRFAEALTTLKDGVIPSLADYFAVKTATFGEQLSWTDTLPDSASTPIQQRSNITSALNDVLDQARANPLTAIILASDGSDNSNAANAAFWDQLSNYNVPIHTIGIGRTTLDNDTEVVSVDMPGTALPGSVQTARVTVQHGDQQSIRVKVYSGNDIVAIQDKDLPGTSGQTTVDIDVDAESTGLQELRFEAEIQTGDISPANNSRKRLLQVKESERKILYFEGEPRWEYKFIRRALHKTPGISLVTILRTTPNKFYRQGIESPEQHANGFPKDKAELYQYDAVILGNVESVSLDATQQQLLHDYVSERGGSLLMLAGDKTLLDGNWQISPVAKALPVLLSSPTVAGSKATYERKHVKATLARAGHHSPITQFVKSTVDNNKQWTELPELADFQRTGELKPGASVLLNAAVDDRTYPLLSHQRYGNGNTYLLATSGTWRWQMQMPSEDQHHETFWRQLLTSLAAGAPQQIQINTDRQIYSDESNLIINAALLDGEFNALSNGLVEATLTSPDGSKRTTMLKASAEEAGVYSASAEIPQTGSWQIDIVAKAEDGTDLTSATQWIYREDGTAEQYALAQNDTFLKRIASATGGRYYPLTESNEVAKTLRSSRTGIVREQSHPLWNAPLFFLLLIGMKLLEWFLRLMWGRL